MTVKQLIAKLKSMPQEAEVEIEILCNRGRDSVVGRVDEVFETVENTVCLESID